MATVTAVKDTKKSRQAAIEAAIASGATTIGGFSLPLGKHTILVADKDAFALLNVERKSDKQKFALPIVAGTITLGNADKTKIAVEISDKPGAKTLVVPDNFYLEMQCNATYDFTVEERNGRKVVTNVTPANVEVEDED
jgi:hypothetical protein